MVQVRIEKIFAETFTNDDAAAMALARTLSRLSEKEREDAIIKVAIATNKNHVFWRDKLAALGSKKK